MMKEDTLSIQVKFQFLCTHIHKHFNLTCFLSTVDLEQAIVMLWMRTDKFVSVLVFKIFHKVSSSEMGCINNI